jgi:hypothetical protein
MRRRFDGLKVLSLPKDSEPGQRAPVATHASRGPGR